MRVIGQSILLLLLIAIASATAHRGIEWLTTTEFLADPNDVRVSPSTAYRLASSDWLEFGLPEHGPIRVLSNCAFKRLDTRAARYALDYEILDSTGKRVLGGRYHHRTQITLLVDSDDANNPSAISKTSYARDRNPGSNAEDFWIETEDLQLPGRLRLRIAEQGHSIVEIAARAYQRSELAPRKSASAWQRLSRRKREKLARAFAISSEWLEPFETIALASHSWRPLGPRGVEDKDYEERVLLIVNDPRFAQSEATTRFSAMQSSLEGKEIR